MRHKSTTHREKFFHLHDDSAYPFNAVTIFARQEADKDWFYSYALCSPSDNFNRAIGRNIARRKYFQKDPTYIGESEPTGDDLQAYAISAAVQNS